MTSLLADAVAVTPLPTFVHDRSSREALGLHLLSSAVRLEHVDRVTERVSLVDASHLARQVEVDIDLGKLSTTKLEGLAADRETLWLPIARYPRSTLGSVVITDGRDDIVPRMTSRDSTRVISAGLVKMFNLLLNAKRDSPREDADGRRARWLIEGAILRLVRDGHLDERTPLVAENEGNGARELANAYLDLVLGAAEHHEQHAFHRLLRIATEDGVVVARVRRDQPLLHLRYDAPELASRSARHADPAAERRTRQRQSPTREFTLAYRTTIPHDVDSFHVTVDVPEQMELRRLLLFSDADRHAVDTLVGDIRNLLADYDALMTHAPAVVSFELRSLRSRLAELGRRRVEDLSEFQRYAERQQPRRRYRAGSLFLDPFTPTTALGTVLQRMTGATRVASALASLRPLPLPETPVAADVKAQWAGIADALERAEIGTDIHLDNDPREIAGHVQWRPHALDLAASSLEAVTGTVWVSLVDARPSQASQVLRFLLASMVIVLVVLLALSRPAAVNDEVFTAADAIVTVLLLVPGLLLTRLDLPLQRTVIARVRSLPRTLAWSSVVVTSYLAIAVATLPTDLLPYAGWPALGVLLVLVGVSVCHLLLGRHQARVPVPPYQEVPRWLLDETPKGAPKRARVLSAVFHE